MTEREITNKPFRKAMEKANMEHIHLFKGEGYFYITGDNLNLQDDMICVNSFNQMSIAEWIDEIKLTMRQSF